MEKTIFVILILAVFAFSLACNKPADDTDDTVAKLITIEGRAEKGALQKGATIEAAQWHPDTGYSGKIFVSETINNQGGYTLEGSTISGLLDIKADGFFINENTGIVDATSRIIISGLYDSESQYEGNINIVTHIIKQRVINLIRAGKTFDEANNQAVTEFYSYLDWTPENPLNTTISLNGKLLFLSAAICKDRTVSQVSNILTTLTDDMSDGIVDLSILDQSFYDVVPADVEANMVAMYGASPDIDQIQADVITFRNISGPAPKVYIVTPIENADFYYYTDTSQLLRFSNSVFSTVTPDVTIKQDGESDVVQNFSLSEFFTISGVLYFSGTIDSELMFFEQDSGVVSIIDELPLKPVQSHIEMNNGHFSIVTNQYEGQDVSDITNITMSTGATRNVMVNNYCYIAYAGDLGLFFVVRDETEILRPSGLYFYPEPGTSSSRIKDAGSMWK